MKFHAQFFLNVELAVPSQPFQPSSIQYIFKQTGVITLFNFTAVNIPVVSFILKESTELEF